MTILPKNKIFKIYYLYLIILIPFSFLINLFYSNIGVFPIDTFLHYDSAFRILEKEYPIRDYWVVSGLIVDVIQAFFFKIIGNSWFAYTIHPSIFNCLITVATYHHFTNNNVSEFKSFILAFCFSILAYTISGTPFVDHHATFFLLIATYLIINNLKNKQIYIWFLIVTLIFLSFLSKQVPVTYIAISYLIILLSYFIKKRKTKDLFKIFSFSLLLIIFFIFILLYNGISLKSFYVQYLDFPRSIGLSRVENLNVTINSFFNHYKFILIPFLLIIIFRIYKIKKNFQISIEQIICFYILTSFIIFLIFHQILTKNQIYIYFLVPVLIGFLEIEINHVNFKFKKYFSFIMLIFLIGVTLKYHLRYNENRKFHELVSVNLTNSIAASNLHINLSGLSWITSTFDGNPSDEIIILQKAQKELENISEEIMLITHYQFLQSITKKNLNYPNKTFTIDGVSMPLKKNKYYEYYKNFLLKKIELKNIKKIYFFNHENLPKELITDYIDKSCYEIKKEEIFYIFKLRCNN